MYFHKNLQFNYKEFNFTLDKKDNTKIKSFYII